jgi:hypothetical protein
MTPRIISAHLDLAKAQITNKINAQIKIIGYAKPKKGNNLNVLG